jgi:hypothetical protein
MRKTTKRTAAKKAPTPQVNIIEPAVEKTPEEIKDFWVGAIRRITEAVDDEQKRKAQKGA